MENQDIELIKLHEYFRKFNFNSKSLPIRPTNTEVKLPTLRRENASISLNKLWYGWQRNLVDLLKIDDNYELQNLISKYTQNDDQFPPDLTKLIRIRKILEMLRPDCILEIGCGTSSLILSNESKRCSLLLTSETATTILLNNLKPFLITSIWPKVIGSKVPGYIATLFIKLNYH